MATLQRHKTGYPGVFFIFGTKVGTNKKEKIFYIRYRKDGKLVEEKAGREKQDDMTAARAATMRAAKIAGEKPTNAKKRKIEAKNRLDEASKVTIGRLWDLYREQNSDKASFKQDKNRWKLYLEKPFSNIKPEKLISLDVDRLRINLLKKKSPQTTKHVLSLLRRLLNFGFNKGLCSLPSFKIQMPMVDNEKTEDLSPNQLKRLLDTIEKDSHPVAGNIMKMALFTGMRPGEIYKLKWEDIDFRRGFIYIKKPKTGISQKIPLNDLTRDLLKKLNRTSEYVFPSPRGGGRIVDLKKQFNKIKQDAALPKDFRPVYGLRHVFASNLISSGKMGLTTVGKLLTHKNTQTTKRYAHLRDEFLKNASNLTSDIISDVMKPNNLRTKK